MALKKKIKLEEPEIVKKKEVPVTLCTLCKKNKTLGVHNAPDGSKMLVCFDCHKGIHRDEPKN